MYFAVLFDPKQVRINEPDMVDDIGWFKLNSLPDPMHSQFQGFYEKFGHKLEEFMA